MSGTTIDGGAHLASFSTPTDREIRVERIFTATRERVWRAFTDPALVAQWWGRGTPVVVERFELERGGYWRIVDAQARGPGGFEGRFREVTPMERIVRTFEWDGLPGHVFVETTTFEDLGNGRTRLVTTNLFHTSGERDGVLHSGMEPAKNAAYAMLDRVLAAMAE